MPTLQTHRRHHGTFLRGDKSRRIPSAMRGGSNSYNDPRSILVVLPTWVGDFVMATPALRAMRERFAGSHIVFLMEANLRDVVRGGGWMNECVEWPAMTERTPLYRAYRDLVWELRRRRFDWAVLFPNSFRAALMVRLAGAKRRIGYDRDGRGFLLTDRVPVRNRIGRGGRNGTGTVGGDGTQRISHTLGERSGGGRDGMLAEIRRTPPTPPLIWGGADHAGPPLVRGGEDGARGNMLGSLHPALPRTVRNGAYRPMPIVEYYADLVESIGCARPGDRLELCTSPECDASVEERIWGVQRSLRTAGTPAVGSARSLEEEEVGSAHPTATTSADCKQGPHSGPYETEEFGHACATSLNPVSRVGIGEARPLVVISPGAKYGAAKCWLPERFAAVADHVIDEHGATVVITCGPGEESLADAIAHAMQRSAHVLHTPSLSLGELKSLIRRADLLIATDSGPRHFAKAFGVPVVTIFGPTHPDWTATSHEEERIVRIDLECSPCQRRTCPLGHHECMKGITVEMVVSASHELLRRRKEVVAV